MGCDHHRDNSGERILAYVAEGIPIREAKEIQTARAAVEAEWKKSWDMPCAKYRERAHAHMECFLGGGVRVGSERQHGGIRRVRAIGFSLMPAAKAVRIRR